MFFRSVQNMFMEVELYLAAEAGNYLKNNNIECLYFAKSSKKELKFN